MLVASSKYVSNVNAEILKTLKMCRLCIPETLQRAGAVYVAGGEFVFSASVVLPKSLACTIQRIGFGQLFFSLVSDGVTSQPRAHFVNVL